VRVRTTVKLLRRDTPDFIIAPTITARGFLTHPTSVLLITESWQCYRSGSVNTLCDMLIR